MAFLLLSTILGFLVGLSYVMIKRKIHPGTLLSATFLALLTAGIWKVFRERYKSKPRRKYF